MFWKSHKWHKIAASDTEIHLNEYGIGVFEIEGRKICLSKYQDKWVAFAYHCPHAGGIMAEGYIDSTGNIVCPVHSYKFNLKNGASKWPEGFCLKVYEVAAKEDGILVKI
jgi:nitrite reductase/ring-hydroxylating ferredoxin subunit